jgi:hypothetical protein
MATISKTKCPYTGPYSVDGNGKHKGNTALALKRAMARCGHLPWEPTKWDNVFNEKLETALDKWDPGKNGYAEGRYDKIRGTMVPKGQPAAGQQALDSVCLALIRAEGDVQAPWAKVGPVFNGGTSILKHDCTHATDGIPLYPAFDDAFRTGTCIIAPEDLKITRASSARPGDACYADGASGLRYWFGHLAYAPAVGRSFKKGYTIGRVAYTNVGGGPHVHVGVNVEKLWGSGRQLQHHTNYTHGAPLIGDQLAARASV